MRVLRGILPTTGEVSVFIPGNTLFHDPLKTELGEDMTNLSLQIAEWRCFHALRVQP